MTSFAKKGHNDVSNSRILDKFLTLEQVYFIRI